MKTVYLAGSIRGLSYKECVEWRNQVRDSLHGHGITTLSPMRSKSFLKYETSLGDADENNPLTSQKGIVTRDRNDVMTCDLVLFNLLDAKAVSIGTMVELGWADAFRKPIVTVLTTDDLHNHAFVRELSGFIVPTLDKAISLIENILGE